MFFHKNDNDREGGDENRQTLPLIPLRDIIVFPQLDKDELRQIVDLFTKRLGERLLDEGVMSALLRVLLRTHPTSTLLHLPLPAWERIYQRRVVPPPRLFCLRSARRQLVRRGRRWRAADLAVAPRRE